MQPFSVVFALIHHCMTQYERVDRGRVFLFLRVDSSSLHASGCVPDLAVLDMSTC